MLESFKNAEKDWLDECIDKIISRFEDSDNYFDIKADIDYEDYREGANENSYIRA